MFIYGNYKLKKMVKPQTKVPDYELIHLDDFKKTKGEPYRKMLHFMPCCFENVIYINKLIKNCRITSKKGISLEQTVHITESNNMRSTSYSGFYHKMIDLDDAKIDELVGITENSSQESNLGIALPRLGPINSLFYLCELKERMFGGDFKEYLHISFSKKGILVPVPIKTADKDISNNWEQNITAFDIQLGGVLPKEYVVPRTH